MTPHEWTVWVRGVEYRAEQAARRQLITAWHTAAFTRQQRLPSLQSLLAPKPTPVELSDAEVARQRAFQDKVAQKMKNRPSRAQQLNEARRQQTTRGGRGR